MATSTATPVTITFERECPYCRKITAMTITFSSEEELNSGFEKLYSGKWQTRWCFPSLHNPVQWGFLEDGICQQCWDNHTKGIFITSTPGGLIK